MEQRICTRCLLRELLDTDEAKRAEYETIEKYKQAILAADRVSDVEYEKRLTVCRACDRLLAGTCAACGCYVELRAAAKVSHCPKKKW